LGWGCAQLYKVPQLEAPAGLVPTAGIEQDLCRLVQIYRATFAICQGLSKLAAAKQLTALAGTLSMIDGSNQVLLEAVPQPEHSTEMTTGSGQARSTGLLVELGGTAKVSSHTVAQKVLDRQVVAGGRPVLLTGCTKQARGHPTILRDTGSTHVQRAEVGTTLEVSAVTA
jgi:hypothetical protein